MKITIKDREVELKYGFRALMIYEKIYGESFNPKGLSEILCFMYCCIIGANEIDLTFQEYLDWMDQNPTVLGDFSNWLANIFGVQDYIDNKNEKADGPVEEGSKKNV